MAWLVGSTEIRENDVLRRARLNDLLKRANNGNSWKCDGQILGRMIVRRLRFGKLPQHGQILIGIGEMIARSHAAEDAIEQEFQRLFRPFQSEAIISRRLREALDTARPHVGTQRRTRPLTTYVDQAVSINDWQCLRAAGDWMRYPTPLGDFAGYGLGFVVRLQLRHTTERLRWFAKEADERRLLLPVVGAVREACFWSKSAARKAMHSGIPFFVGFGVARLRDGGEDGKGWTASELDDVLAEHQVPFEGRMHVSALMLKEAVHAWHRQKDRPYENQRRRALLRLEPKHAVGGERYAQAEIERLVAEEASLDARRTAVLAALDDALRTAARHDVAPNELSGVFEPSLVDTPEIRHRFAIAHATGPIRCAALQASLTALDELIGARRPENICEDNLDTVRAGREFAYWTAASQIELSKASGRDAGHRAIQRRGLLG